MTHAESARRRAAMADRVASGRSTYAVASEYSVSVELVRRACRENGVITGEVRKVIGETKARQREAMYGKRFATNQGDAQ